MSAEKKPDSGLGQQLAVIEIENPELARAFQRISESIEKHESAKIYQLEIWPDRQLGVPNEITRSALFAAIQAKGRTYVNNQPIASQAGF